MSFPNDPNERKRLSTVSISPISPDALHVRIRRMSSDSKEEDIPKFSSAFKPISRKPDVKNNEYSKLTMADNQKASSSSQIVQKEQSDSHSVMANKPDSPCLKHAAENIGRKASDIPNEKIDLCCNCSKSMLSYIFLVQDFLDSLAKEISGDASPKCLQCAREEARNSVAFSDNDLSLGRKESPSNKEKSESHAENVQSKKISQNKDESSHRTSSKRTSRNRSHRQESKRNDESSKSASNAPQGYANQQINFVYNVTSPPNTPKGSVGQNYPVNIDRPLHSEQSSSVESQTVPNVQHPVRQGVDYSQHPSQQGVAYSQHPDQQGVNYDQNPNQDKTVYSQNFSQKQTEISDSNRQSEHLVTEYNKRDEKQSEFISHPTVPQPSVSSGRDHFQSSPPNEQGDSKTVFHTPMERAQPNYDTVRQDNTNKNDPNFSSQHSRSLFSDGVDGIISTLSNAEREIYDTARNRAGWESLTEPQERLGPSSGNLISSEAFVTSCRNNAEAIGCLVVGTSLLLCRTSRTLCVLVSDGVSAAFRGALSAVFQVVQNVRALDSLGTTKLSLLEQPELGVSFDKLNVWRLTQFNKCVYLNPDTLVIQNCDELFCHEELSAVPDIGWPDCFNSGVFVFAPSVHTFWQLMEFAEKQGSYDGGDQGLLNSYFNSWSADLNKKLSFIYNLMANVSYTYTPAFRQFGRNVKIVQFHGSFKPWHVKFFPTSGQISPSSPVHPTYVQFVHIWLNIFRISVLRLLSQEIQSYAASQETICAVEILRFFPLPSESEAEFFLTPPSVRLRLAEKKLSRSTSLPMSAAQRRKSAEFFRYTNPEDESISEKNSSSQEVVSKDTPETDASKSVVTEPVDPAKIEESTLETDDVFKEKGAIMKKKVDENTLPGAEVGDYQGMKAWEQGRIDYEGNDSSDNVIKRLQFLMKPK